MTKVTKNGAVNPTGVTKVKKPEAMADHKQTKQFKDEGQKVEKAKTVTKEKMTRAQLMDKFQVDIAKIAETNHKLAKTAQRYYEAMFQIDGTKEFMNLVQSINEENETIVLKTGFELPVLPKEGVIDFMDFFTTITDIGSSPVTSIVKSKIDGNVDDNNALFAYALFELLAKGRKAHQIDWNEVEAEDGFDFSEGVYTRVYLAISEFSENPEENAGIIKGMLLDINADAFDVFHPLFSRDSLKKIGIAVNSPLYNGEYLIDAGVAEFISNVLFDTYGDYTPETDEDEEEPEVEESPAKKSKTSLENTQKQQEEVTGGEDDEDEDELEVEDEDSPFEDDEEDDGIDEDEEEWDEEDEE